MFDGIMLVEAITNGIQYLCQHLYLVLKPPLLFFFSNETAICKKERGASLVDVLTLDVPLSLGHLDLAVQVLGTCSK